MKVLTKARRDLQFAGRWDIDYHLPAEGIKVFDKDILYRVDQVADVAKDKRDPGRSPETAFKYVDIAAVDVTIGTITNPQDMEGGEAPSRARKVVRAFDLIISTCRPTRGAIAVVQERLHNQVASTAFSVLRAKNGVNPFYLHYALRLPSTLEQFRKWSTGSSYPAILDSDVKKTLIPVPNPEIQDDIAKKVLAALRERAKIIRAADQSWLDTLKQISGSLAGRRVEVSAELEQPDDFDCYSLSDIQQKLATLPPLTVDRVKNNDDAEDLLEFDEAAE